MRQTRHGEAASAKAIDSVPLLIAQMYQNGAKSRANPNQGTVMDQLRAVLASDLDLS